jgi:hypothetical protein
MLTQKGLSKVERELCEAVASQDRVEFDAGNEAVGAALIRRLVLGVGIEPKCRKLTVYNAVIEDPIDLEAGTLRFPVKFHGCQLRAEVNLEQARAEGVYFVACTMCGLAADQLRTTVGLVVRECTVSGGITLRGAHIGGQLELRASTLVGGPDNVVLVADGLVVEQDADLSEGFQAEGQVRLIGARIGGQLTCVRATFTLPGGTALDARGLTVGEHVFWQKGFHARGEIRLDGGCVNGLLDCSGGRFDNRGARALSLSGLTVKQDVRFTAGATAEGTVDMTGCRVGGHLELTGGVFRNAGTIALDLARADIAQNMICQSGFDVTGKVLLAGAEIAGNLWCEGGSFHNPTDVAVDATGLTVHRDVHLSCQPKGEGFLAQGKVLLSDASIGGSLRCSGGRFSNQGDVALGATGLSVTRDVLLGVGFGADGEVDLTDSEIGGRLCGSGGKFRNRSVAFKGNRMTVKQSAEFGVGFRAEGTIALRDARFGADLKFEQAELAGCDNAPALTLSGAKVGGTLGMHFQHRPKGSIDLSGATVGLLDDRNASWPDEVRLDDFVYRMLPQDGPGVPDVDARLAFLRKHGRYVPQIYLQLTSTYSAAGLDQLATKVSIAGEDERWRSYRGLLGGVLRVLGLLLKLTVRYGYRPLQVLWSLLVLEIVGSVLFEWLFVTGDFTRHTAGVPDLNPVLYTADLLLPVVSLKQRDNWVPLGAAEWGSAVFTGLGWVLALCLVAGVGRIVKTR